MFEIVYEGRTTDGRRLDGYTISSPCEPNGSGELKSKREIIQSLSYRILPTVNQVTYTLDTIYDLNIMTLTQAVLGLFCSQTSIES